MSQAATAFDPQSPEINVIDLARALACLERKILSTPPDPRLLYSSHERTKTAANLEYARTLLLRLEHTSSRLKIQSRRQEAQSTLLSQRALLKRITDRLHELDQEDRDWPSDASPPEDDLLLSDDDEPTATGPAPPASMTSNPHTDTQSTLRNRFRPPSPIQADTITPLTPTSPSQNNTNTTTILESASTTQADLTSALTAMATQLKTNSLLFAQTLEADKAAMAQASEALDKNAEGMSVAGKRMGLLRRMNEGKGWWGRMMLYVWIGGLWVLATGLVFVGPKFRF
ncbi:MAG: hypothetical protein HETSPECPRED_000054 [Heterodermia speciosa]|uniref:Synaptobrevin n=1 Tax=Heterodermia speciosa TaxID=116794 RepID=A0A8H3ED55_9LECA|nr:MAG: hypothetical protein HETSPECPRED_000054 [Heterodermia speciosa]